MASTSSANADILGISGSVQDWICGIVNPSEPWEGVGDGPESWMSNRNLAGAKQIAPIQVDAAGQAFTAAAPDHRCHPRHHGPTAGAPTGGLHPLRGRRPARPVLVDDPAERRRHPQLQPVELRVVPGRELHLHRQQNRSAGDDLDQGGRRRRRPAEVPVRRIRRRGVHRLRGLLHPRRVPDVHPRRRLGRDQRVTPQRDPRGPRRRGGRSRASSPWPASPTPRPPAAPTGSGPSPERSTPRSPRSTPSPPTPCSTSSPQDSGACTLPDGPASAIRGQRITSCVLADALAYRPWAIGQFGGAGAGTDPAAR